MALPARAGHRRSFVDARNDGRQMEVTWHAEAGVLVVSLWQGPTCRSTFRLPVEDAPALIGILSSALGDAASSSRLEGSRPRATARSRLLGMLRGLAPRSRADVVPLRCVPNPSSDTGIPIL